MFVMLLWCVLCFDALGVLLLYVVCVVGLRVVV